MEPPPSILPQPLDVPAAQRARGESPLRYDDVTQDGRMALSALPHIETRAFELNDSRVGAAACLRSATAPDGPPLVTARLAFST